MNSNFESRVRNSAEMKCSLLCPIGEHDVCDPIFQDDALIGIGAFEFETHAEASVAVYDLCPAVESALVAHDLDDHSGADAEWGEGIDIASADADFGGSGNKL